MWAMLLMCLPLAIMTSAAEAQQTSGSKAGIAMRLQESSEADRNAIAASNLGWYKNWGRDGPTQQGLEFIPMIWGATQIARLNSCASVQSSWALLGFNEPNMDRNWGGADMSMEEVVRLWPQVERCAQERGVETLVGPAVANVNPVQWYDEFFSRCSGCRVDAIAIHSYNCDVASMRNYINNFKKYNKPLWLTEFACADNPQGIPGNTARSKSWNWQCRYMQDVIPLLMSEPAVAKFSWFSYNSDYTGESSLVSDGRLTPLGECYNALAGDTTLCTGAGVDRWGPDRGGCCTGLEECNEPRGRDDASYCSPTDSRHGWSCWSTVINCREQCAPLSTSPAPTTTPAAPTTDPVSCSGPDADRWGPNYGGCCSGLEECTEPRAANDVLYCPATDARHGSQCWSTIAICRSQCISSSTSVAPTTDPVSCSGVGTDRWWPNYGGCCSGLQDCLAPRPTDDSSYCPATNAGHGSSCWSTVVTCRSQCALPSTTPTPTTTPELDCAPFSQWPSIDNGVTCGRCKALVLTAPYSGSCDTYCRSFGQTCFTAEEEVHENCVVRYSVPCSEEIRDTSDMLCTCQNPPPTPPPEPCTSDGADRWNPNLGGCCGGLEECQELRADDDASYCASSDPRHGSSCWSTIIMCRSQCMLPPTVGPTQGPVSCSESDADRWVPDRGGCCSGLEECIEPRVDTDPSYCAASDPRHGVSCWNSIIMCRSQCGSAP